MQNQKFITPYDRLRVDLDKLDMIEFFEKSAFCEAMCEGQLRPCGITNEQILLALSFIPRELFIPHFNPEMASLAYRDSDIAVGYDRWLFSPLLCARMLEALDVKATDFVLDVCTGTGYSAAILAALAYHVVALEQDPDLIQIAENNFALIQAQNIDLIHGIVEGGWKSSRLYDVIFMNGVIEYLPASFVEQLAEGGRVVCLFAQQIASCDKKNDPYLASIRLYKKVNGYVSHRDIFDVTTRIIPIFREKEHFVL